MCAITEVTLICCRKANTLAIQLCKSFMMVVASCKCIKQTALQYLTVLCFTLKRNHPQKNSVKTQTDCSGFRNLAITNFTTPYAETKSIENSIAKKQYKNLQRLLISLT